MESGNIQANHCKDKTNISKQVKSNDFIYLKDHYICMGDWVQLALF